MPSNGPSDRHLAIAKRRGLVVAIALASFASLFLMDWFVRLLMHDIDRRSGGIWASAFVVSPGAGGVAAVVAASIGAVTISRQLRHNKRVEQDRSWWQGFEWATNRALPVDGSHERLPYALSINMLTPLSTSASNDVQREACSGFVDHLLTLRSGEETITEQPAAAPGHSTETSKGYRSGQARALRAYVAANQGGAGRSSKAESLLYELNVLDAAEHAVATRGGTFIRPYFLRSRNGSTERFDGLASIGKGRAVILVNPDEVSYKRVRALENESGLDLGDGSLAVVLVIQKRSAARLDLGSSPPPLIVTWDDDADNESLVNAFAKLGEV